MLGYSKQPSINPCTVSHSLAQSRTVSHSLAQSRTVSHSLAPKRAICALARLVVSGTIARKSPRSWKLDSKLNRNLGPFGDHELHRDQAMTVARVPWYSPDQVNVLLFLAVDGQ
ncbi:hypothetical protein Q7P35_003745 [Cladosporium inversicolor]